jgi:DNA-binding beta-propeller fold protein YncE
MVGFARSGDAIPLEADMQRISFAAVATLALAVWCAAGVTPRAQATGPYKVMKTQKVGGNGGFDYVVADPVGRRLYVARRPDTASKQPARVNVFDLDTLAPVGEITDVSAHGVAIDPKSGHGFASSKPVTMFDTKTLKVIKTIDVDGSPDGLLFDPFNGRVHVLSHSAPNDTVINAADGTVVGTIDLGGAPEQAQSDGKGTIYVDLENKNSIGVVDAAAMKVTGTYDISAKCEGPGGLGLDAKNHVLFATCDSTMTIVSATDGKILAALPIGAGTDGGGFNPETMEAFSSNGGAGTLSIIKEESPTKFVVEQDLPTVSGGNFKTMTIDTKTNHILLIGAAYEAAPAPAPTTPPPATPPAGRGRRMMVADSFTILVVGK